MCRANIAPEAEEMLARLLRDMAAALDPEHPETVIVGPVDFGPPEIPADFGSAMSGALTHDQERALWPETTA